MQGARRVAVEAMQHGGVQFQLVVIELLPKRAQDASRNAVFQAMLAWEAGGSESGAAELSLGPAVSVDWARVADSCAAKCDLFLTAGAAESTIEGSIRFNSDLFERTSGERLATRLAVLTAALADAAPTAYAWSLPLMPAAETELVLQAFNETSASFATDLCIHDLVAEEVSRTPDATALEWHGAMLTYAELWTASAKVAAWLVARGVISDRVVALQLHRSLEQVVGMLGVLRSGGAYLPLDPKWPRERRQFMADDAGCAQLVAQSPAAFPVGVAEGDWFVGAVLHLDDVRSLGGLESGGLATCAGGVQRAMPHHLAYVMYTSGSTGTPKGVMVPHAGVVNLLLGARQRYARDSNVVFGMATPYVFDVSVYNIFASLVVHCGTCQLVEDGSSLVSLGAGDKMTHVAAVPSILAIARLPPSVRHVEAGGEALSHKAVANVPVGVGLYNYYGPTEVAIWATRREVAFREGSARLASIGAPLPNVVCYVVDADVASPQLCPIGVWGELWLGGVQVARGYLNRRELSAERFVTNPWAANDPSGRGVVYRSGDRVRWYADGEIEFGGRIDFQVKLRGQRIELGEVEHALCVQPGVAEAVVLLDSERDVLVAYISPASTVLGAAREGGAVPFSRVGALGGASLMLPSHMLPSLVVGVDVWPRTSSNKIDRKRLPGLRAPSSLAIGELAPQCHQDSLVTRQPALSGDMEVVRKIVYQQLLLTLGLPDASKLDPCAPLM
eukprot:1422011-Prymnesium_polylepis.1